MINRSGFKGCEILVVGGEGFIGRNLVSKLKQLEANVTSIGTKKSGRSNSDHYICVDILNREGLIYLLKNRKFDYVFNLSGYVDHSAYSRGGREIIDVHYYGLLNLLEAIDWECLRSFVNVGSGDEYGANMSPQTEAVREAPISPYSSAKVAGTHFLQGLYKRENFPSVVVRPFLTYGPDQDGNRLIPQVIYGCLKNEAFPVSEGAQLRDFCFIDDLIEGIIVAAISENSVGEVFNLASGMPISVRSVIELILEVVGKGKPMWGKVCYRPGENMCLFASIDKAKSVLGWNPKVSLEEGIRVTVDFYKRNRKLEI